MFVSGIKKGHSKRGSTLKSKATQPKDKVLHEFFSNSFLQMLELLEEELACAFEGVKFNYKGTTYGRNVSGSNSLGWSHKASEIIPYLQTRRFELNLSIYCSLEFSKDIEFWGHTTLFVFQKVNNEWFVTCEGEKTNLDNTLAITWKKMALRHMYFKIMDNYNENY